METLLTRLRAFDRHRLALAPFLGLLAGFLANRAHDGAGGWTLFGEMLLGAILVSFGAGVLVNIKALIEEREIEASREAQARKQAAEARHLALVEAEAKRYRAERFFREQILVANRRSERLELELLEQRTEARTLRDTLHRLEHQAKHAGSGPELAALQSRLADLENASRFAEEARSKILALESAQEELRRDQVAISQRASTEAEEVKTSLLQMAITESQRMRNMDAPDNEQSGRIIELEARIRRLAREIETLSRRQGVIQPDGKESLVKPGGTQDKARIGFLQAMLDANKTLRKRVNEAA
jgi:hypothetical protein